MRSILVSLILVSGGPHSAIGTIRIVPDQFSRIQSAIAASSAVGDTVPLRTGTSRTSTSLRKMWSSRVAEGRKAPARAYYAEVQACGHTIVTRLMILR